MLRSLVMVPAVVLGTLAPYAIQAVSHPAPSQAAPCADMVIGVDGTGSVGDPNSLVKMRAGKGAWIIQYPGSIYPIGPYTYDHSVRLGVNETKRVIREFRALNPCGTVHITGHSQGARVAGDAIAELFAEGVDTSFITADLLSDPRHPGTGIEVALQWLRVPGYSMRGERSSFGGAQVNQVCVPADPICDTPRSLLGVLRTPLDFARLHAAY